MHETQVDQDIQLKALIENAQLTSRRAVRVKAGLRNSGMTRPSGAGPCKRRIPNDIRRRRCRCAAMCAVRLAPAAGRLPSCYDWREARLARGAVCMWEEDGETREARGRGQPEPVQRSACQGLHAGPSAWGDGESREEQGRCQPVQRSAGPGRHAARRAAGPSACPAQRRRLARGRL